MTGTAVYRPVFTSTALAPESSSSSAEEPESSASEKPESSSAEVAEASSSSADKPKSSASEEPTSSSSAKPDGLYPTVAGVNMVFAHNELTVTVSKASEVKVQVFDMQGHLQDHYLGYSAGDHVVSLGHLNRGVYIVRVANGNAVKTQRIMIK